MTFSIATLGCKVNQYETQRIRQALCGQGMQEIPFGGACDITIINTCTVTHRADAESRKLIRRALGQCARLIVTGCGAAASADAIHAISGTIEVVPPKRMGEILEGGLPEFITAFGGQTRAFVKIQEGCNNFCSFCIVPFTRGAPASRPADAIIAEINGLSQAGFKEVVLTGINIGLYEGGLTAIIQKILEQTGIERLRISSLEPWTIDAGLEELLSSPRLCRHLHLPLQSGCARILAAMGRPYTLDYYARMVDALHKTYPDLCIGADLMTGFPGEDEAAFQEGFSFVNALDLSYLHVFPYSIRPGTKAAGMPDQVHEADKKQRTALLRELSEQKRAAFIAAQAGSIQQVLVTKSAGGFFTGLSSNYISLQTPGEATVGELRLVRVSGTGGHLALGEMDE